MSVKIYPHPAELDASPNYRVYINDQEIFVYDTQVAYDSYDATNLVHAPMFSSYAAFGIDPQDSVRVRVETTGYREIDTVELLPKSAHVSAIRTNSSVEFTIDRPLKLCIRINGEDNRILMLFANQNRCYDIDFHAPNVHYYGPGVHVIDSNPHNQIVLTSDSILFLDEGAYVFGRVIAQNCKNIKILGPGVLCGTRCNGIWADWLRPLIGNREETPRYNFVNMLNVENVEIDGASFLDTTAWTIDIRACRNVRINDIKLIGYQMNSDGIDICSSENVVISDCFIRTSDDCIVMKAIHDYGDTANVSVKDCIVWADRASGLEIGHEINKSDIHNIEFKNIDILNCTEDTYGYHAIDITNVDSGRVYDVVFDTIRIERCVRLIGFRIRKGIFSNQKIEESGQIYNITLKNIESDLDRAIFMFGKDEQHKVHDIQLINIRVAGTQLTTLKNVYHNSHIDNIALYDDSGNELDRLQPYPDPAENKYIPVDISKMANMSFGHDRTVYMKNFDFLEMPSGLQKFDGIPFRIIGQGYNPGGEGDFKRGVIPPERVRYTQPAATNCDFYAKYLFFLHTAINTYSEIDSTLARYIITYEDGIRETICVRNLNDCHDITTWSRAGWQITFKSLCFYIMPWQNPRPDKKIERIEMKDGDIPDFCALFAITRV